MKKIINRPDVVVVEMVEGLAAVYPSLRKLPGHTVLARADAAEVRDRQVALISGGGSGHEPAHAGYVGRGMLSAAVSGDVFTSPSPDTILAAIRAVGGAKGTLLIVKNYTGDRLNFGLAAELAKAEGLAVEAVIVADDVALADTTEHAGRRGIAGTVLVHKVAGAAAEAGSSLTEVAAEARAAADAVATMGVALSACTVPAAGKPGFTLGDDEVELGLGIHGEPGVRRAPLEPADALVDHLLAPILTHGRFERGDRVVLLVNNLGGSTTMELAIVARHAISVLEDRGLVVERVYCGTFLSALEMAGVSLSVLLVDDARLARLDAPTEAPTWPNASGRSRVKVQESVTPTDVAKQPPPAGPPRTQVGRSILAAIEAVTAALIADAPRLNDLDRAVGDGDLGISLARAAAAVQAALPTLSLDHPADGPQAIGLTLQGAMGGTSGPLYAVFCIRAANRIRTGSETDASVWADAFEAGCQGIADLGGAQAGDRTMLDALLPASTALRSALSAGKTPAEALHTAAEAAEAGARATANMKPRRGRSSYLGDRVLGHIDPGAEAVAIWLRAIAKALAATA
jgi:triose/dihydroxyacetone kinase / FAD-AMP lyase (cyclizing)